MLGAFSLTSDQIKRIGIYDAYTLPENMLVPAALTGQAKKEANGFYIGVDPLNP